MVALKAIITVGAAGSGKSTWARNLASQHPGEYVIIERDAIRHANGIGPVGDSAQERFVTKVQNGQIEAALLDGLVPIVANTNTNKDIRKSLIRQLHKYGADVEVHVVHPPLDVVLAQNAERGGAMVPEDVVRRMWQSIESQKDSIQSVYRLPEVQPYRHSAREKVIVVDIDGTVADSVGIRSPHDYSRVSEDKAHHNVIDIVRAMSATYKIIFVSGRKDDCRNVTVQWLNRHVGVPYTLFMREAADDRADFIIKNEIYDRDVIPFYDIIAVLDDRDQVVTHLRARGITVLQVAPGRF